MAGPAVADTSTLALRRHRKICRSTYLPFGHVLATLPANNRTQDVEDRLQPGFYGGAYRGPFFVLRHDPPADPPVVMGVSGQFIDLGIEDAVALAKDAADGANVVVFGASIARQCLEAGLLDEIIVHVAPVLVGAGIRLYESPGGAPIRLDPISSHEEGETTVLRYTARR